MKREEVQRRIRQAIWGLLCVGRSHRGAARLVKRATRTLPTHPSLDERCHLMEAMPAPVVSREDNPPMWAYSTRPFHIDASWRK
jgi:hypothetical protein